jgi:preprotein translocase subunit SecY
MLRNLMAAWSIPDVRARIMYVFYMIMLFVVGLHIPVPGVNLTALEALVRDIGVLTLFDTFSGGALRKFTIFALGVTPYINSSIIMQLLTVALPSLEAKAKEGEGGRKEIAKYTRFLTVALALFQSFALITMLSNQSAGGGMGAAAGAIFTGGWATKIQVMLTLTAGTVFLMWIGESITEKGIGQGISMLIFVSIMARLPYDIGLTYTGVAGEGALGLLRVALLLMIFLGTIVGIVYVTGGTRKVPIQHAKRQVGNKMVQSPSSFLPFKVNGAGVMPIIFAISLLMFPGSIATYLINPKDPNSPISQFARHVQNWTTPGVNHFASLVYAVLIVVFTYFYSAIMLNIPELTDNLKKYGSFIPGIRPGRPTQEYLDRILTRITFAGAIFLAIIGLIQYYIPNITGISTFSLVGGTSLLIVVGVALDFMQNLESHLVMRNYDGFIRRGGGGRRGGGPGTAPVSLR